MGKGVVLGAQRKARAAAAVAAKSVLHRVAWQRIVLDEAHAIKDRRLDPYCFYFCKVDGCDCKCREYHFDAEYRKCMYCGHSPLQHFSLFNQDVVNPIKKFGYVGAGKNAFITLKRGVLDRLLLRRTKAGRADEMVLPPKVVTIEAHFLDHRETDFYQGLYTQSQAQFGAYVEAGTLLNNYAHVLDLLTRLRQAINHPYLVLYSKREMANADAERDADGPATTSAAQVAAAGVSAAGQSKAGLLARLDLRKFQSSTKIEALMEELHLMREHDPSAKAIVFSQFVSFLDIVEHRLLLAGIRVVKLNGGMTAGARETFLKAFREDPAVVVILISLKAGGVALNLTVASHIYLMDPWWNPAAEYQAIDRAHRLGQHKPIRAVRFVVRNTVEERILRLQDKKRLVFEGTVGGDAKALGQLSEEDLRFLFS
ncbi:ATP-dependent helicase rhp16-like protein [Chrysochromulina tobinii]|uniref:ATP-dependent helicase rhp16-like protein n=1 Tax=Chrysochromulina tobinii TaxID=1460289 RepID=A0A0M0JWC3_9EUKA|nr:ATP-dependent helicase rhp16-like protein [Chrysochromulina tobinii]|eukprot:KOO30433.1 ATP-dependent helicase rhp16-like protein [Chrysochromulina sp. CCMP291]